MKAVKRFKGLLSKRRPELLDSILGQETRIFQPPQTMSKVPAAREHLRLHKAHSVDTHDRRPIEGALAREGVHRIIDPDKIRYPVTQRDDTAATGRGVAKPTFSHHPQSPRVSSPTPMDGAGSPPQPKSPQNKQPLHVSTLNEPRLWGKGQAHDPLTESFLWLHIGPSNSASSRESPSPEEEAPVVSESPHAAEGNIYETAYHEEVERLRSNSRSATLYLTRRVKNTEKYKDDGNMKGVDERHADGATGWGKKLQSAKDKARKVRGHEDKGKSHDGENEAKTEGNLRRLMGKMKKEVKLHEENEREEGGGKCGAS